MLFDLGSLGVSCEFSTSSFCCNRVGVVNSSLGFCVSSVYGSLGCRLDLQHSGLHGLHVLSHSQDLCLRSGSSTG